MNNCVVITGASRGIGRATAEHFRQQDWDVVNVSRHPCTVEGVVNVTVDLTQPDWLAQHSDALHAATVNAERLCLVHNAAQYVSDNVLNVDVAQFRQVMELNVIAPMQLNQLFVPHMKFGSSIIYIGSTLAHKAVANVTSYATTKHALVGLMRSTCQDLAGKGIHTCCVCPGFTDTEMLREHVGDNVSFLEDLVTAKRLVQPGEIAKVVGFCAENPVVNGSLLDANLGQVER